MSLIDTLLTGDQMAEAFTGQITPWAVNYPPENYMYCAGQTLQAQQYQALYSLVQNTFGGTAYQTFCLPNLSGQSPVGYGQRSDGTAFINFGETGGKEEVTLVPTDVAHTHAVQAYDSTTAVANLEDPASGIFAHSAMNPYTASGTSLVALNSAVVTPFTAGGTNMQHENRQPYLALNFIICLNGWYPIRP
jgi:microcystin-dependent protein